MAGKWEYVGQTRVSVAGEDIHGQGHAKEDMGRGHGQKVAQEGYIHKDRIRAWENLSVDGWRGRREKEAMVWDEIVWAVE